jgi:hypothetical protein
MMFTGSRAFLERAPLALLLLVACTKQDPVPDLQRSLGTGGATGGAGGSSATGGSAAESTGGDTMMGDTGGTAGMGATGGTSIIPVGDGMTDPLKECPPTTCMAQGVGCGKIIDKCGNITDCAAEGLTCGALEVCTGSADMPATCQSSTLGACDLCHSVPDCSKEAQDTAISGRVITPGRDDANTGNQVGVPNAAVYILANKGFGDLPAITSGIPAGGTSCDRCEDQELGPTLVQTITDATGAFTLQGHIPVGEDFTLVVKAGRFRRAVSYKLEASDACQTKMLPTALPDNPTRLPRSMMDGDGVNLPRIAVTTGEIDAMECVLEKMGIAHEEFGNPGDGTAAPRVHIYRGRDPQGKGDGASIDTATPLEDTLYGDAARLTSYDLVLADCEGAAADTTTGRDQFAERDAYGATVADYVNRGGRMFVSHLRYSWLYQNGMQAYDPANPNTTGLDAAATWDDTDHHLVSSGTGKISLTRPQASPRIQNFADWMAKEAVAAPPDYTFDILQPRSQATGLGTASEEFVLTTSVTSDAAMMGDPVVTTSDVTQQFSFNTPYGAPNESVCGRVAYSGFHVSIGDTTNAIFPTVCTGDLTKQEKVLLYMLFDLNACVGMTPPPPICTPETCDSLHLKCGFAGDTCGGVLDCGPCPLPMEK